MNKNCQLNTHNNTCVKTTSKCFFVDTSHALISGLAANWLERFEKPLHNTIPQYYQLIYFSTKDRKYRHIPTVTRLRIDEYPPEDVSHATKGLRALNFDLYRFPTKTLQMRRIYMYRVGI